MIWQLIFLLILISNSLGNHYETLGVSRSATDYDIKKSYKKLARIWHPDKSRSPGASEHFMKINEAYEILSDPEKRKEYDAFGTVSNEPRGNDGFHRNHFWNSNFGNAFFQAEDHTKDTRFESVDYRSYKMNIIPDSNKKPTLMLLVTHFCAACHYAMRLWGNIAEQITDSGIRMGISDVMRDSQLREELKIHHVPSVVFVIDGQVKYIQADINKENIIEFIRQSYPRNIVHMIRTEEDLNNFHNLWMKDSRSKMIMTKPLERASFRYLSVAFKYRDKVTAGFVYLDEKVKGGQRDIVNAYRLDYDEETLLIFNDEKQNYNKLSLPKPVAQISRSRLTIDEMEYLVEANHQLPLSRLLSQSVFDRACPPPSQKQRSFGFCVIAIVHSKHGINLSEADNWQYLRSLVDERSRGKMLYLYADIQLEFLKSLHLFDQATNGADAFLNQVILLWRQSYESAASIFLSNPWEYPNLDWVMSNWNLLSNFDTAVPMLTTKNRIQSKFADSESLSELVDELAAPLIWRIWERIMIYLQQMIIFIYDNLLDPFTLTIILMAFILLSYSYTTIKAVSRHLSEDEKNHSKSSNTNSNARRDADIRASIHDLTPDSYKCLINSSQPGKLIIALLATEITPTEPISMIIGCVAKLKCKIQIEPLTLKLDKHTNWLSSAIGYLVECDEQRKVISTISSLSLHRPVPEEGIVLALNISRNYLLICPINVVAGSPFPFAKKSRKEEMATRKRCLRNATYFVESDDSDSDNDRAAAATTMENNGGVLIENRFFDWLCQLTEGTCKRYYVSQWPGRL